MARLAAAVIFAALVLLFSCPDAHADPGNFGPGPAPSLCAYPGVGDAGVAGALVPGYWYWCDFPTELNGSHWHCQYMGAAGSGSAGFSMMVSVGMTGLVGGLIGGCHFVCPSGLLAQTPNPPGGWKDAIRPTQCQPIGPNPDLPPPSEDVPIAPPIAEQGAVPAIPFGQPQPQPGAAPEPPAPPVEPPLAQQLPSVTNPACPNPAATVNASCH
jgi:hypothetical protein